MQTAIRQRQLSGYTNRRQPFDGGTELTLIDEHLPDEEARKSHEEGWKGFLAKLQIFPGDLEGPI